MLTSVPVLAETSTPFARYAAQLTWPYLRTLAPSSAPRCRTQILFQSANLRWLPKLMHWKALERLLQRRRPVGLSRRLIWLASVTWRAPQRNVSKLIGWRFTNSILPTRLYCLSFMMLQTLRLRLGLGVSQLVSAQKPLSAISHRSLNSLVSLRLSWRTKSFFQGQFWQLC